jgi:hypothetical protein
MPTVALLSRRRLIRLTVLYFTAFLVTTFLHASKQEETVQLAFLTPPFLGGISAEVCEISQHNSDFL